MMASGDILRPLKDQKNDIFTKEDLVQGESLLKVDRPEPWIKRKQAVDAAKQGTYPIKQCQHPVSRINQFFDHVNDADREGRPTNLFECEVCHSLLFLADPYGRVASDG